MPDATAIASTDAAWNPRSAKARSAASSIWGSRTSLGTRRVPRVWEVTVRDGAIAVILLRVSLPAVTSGGITSAETHHSFVRRVDRRARAARERRGAGQREGGSGR